MTPEEYLAIPYVLVVESVEGPDGQWFRRAMYPELGISGEALSPLDAIAKLEEARVSTILGKLERGEPVPVPRPPLREEIGGLDAQKLGFAKWLVDQKRVGTIVFGKALLRDRDEEEVRGYRKALDLIHNKGARLPIPEATIRQLHGLSRGGVGDAGE